MQPPISSAATTSRAIFRSEALQRYVAGQDKVVLPTYVAGSSAALMWTLVAVLIGAATLLAIARVPIHTRGSAVVTARADRAVVFFPAQDLPRLAAGQAVRLFVESTRTPIHTHIDSVEPRPISPTDARDRYALDDAAALAIVRPSAVATVTWPVTGDAATYAGSIMPAIVDTGSERLSEHVLHIATGSR